MWAAARAGDLARVKAALDKGADVNAKARYNMTALAFAADKGHLEIVKLLIEKGADINTPDTFYKMRAVNLALQNKHFPVATLLLEKGSAGASHAIFAGIQAGNEALVKLALAAPDLTADQVASGVTAAKESKNAAMIALLEAKAASMPVAATVTIAPAVLQSYAGRYRSETQRRDRDDRARRHAAALDRPEPAARHADSGQRRGIQARGSRRRAVHVRRPRRHDRARPGVAEQQHDRLRARHGGDHGRCSGGSGSSDGGGRRERRRPRGRRRRSAPKR